MKMKEKTEEVRQTEETIQWWNTNTASADE